MLVVLTARNVDLTPRVDKRIKKLVTKLNKLLDDSASAHVILSTEKHRYQTEIVFTWHDHRFTSMSETNDLETSVSEAITKIHRQALKLKEKFAARRRIRRKGTEEVTTPSETRITEPRIIRTRRKVVKPLTPEEAALHLTESEDHFLVFRDAERDRVSVLFKRKDGNYGLIEP